MDRTDYCFGRIDPFDNRTPYRCALKERGFAPGCKCQRDSTNFRLLKL